MSKINLDEKNNQYKDIIKNLKKKYCDNIKDAFAKKFNVTNPFACPKITHIVLSKGLSTASGKAVDQTRAIKNLESIAGQKALVIKAKKSVSQFRISEGRVNGCKVTLRRDLMYLFLEKLIEYYFVSKRNFYGIQSKSFNNQKTNISVNMGVDDERLFPEITASNSSLREGFNITIVTNASKLEHAEFLIDSIGIPIRNN